jgi:hypothetical protein
LRQAGFRIARQMAFDTFCPRRYPICRDETLIVPGVSSKTALLCLNRICASDGVDTQKIAADVVDDVEDRVLPLDRVIALARKSGLQLRSATLDWRALLAGTATKTVLLVLRNANVVHVLGSGRDGVEEVVVSDPLYQSGEPFFLPRVSLERAWGGETLILKRKRRKVERTLALCLSILSICGLAAGLLLVSQAAIDGTLAGSNSLHHETSAAVSSDSSANAAESNDTQSTAARTNVTVRLMNVSEVAQPSVLVSLTASPENGKGISAGEVQKTEQPAIGVQQGSDASTVATPANAQELPQTFEKSDAISAQSPVGEAPQTFTPAATTPTLQTNAVSAKTARLSLSPDEVTALLTRGDSLFAKGDIASARLFYERAAEAGDGQAALRLGESYDPAFLARTHLSGVRGDALAAARWYRRAHELGTTEAETLLRTIVPEKDQRLP